MRFSERWRRKSQRQIARDLQRQAHIQSAVTRPLGSDGLSARGLEMVKEIEQELRELEPAILAELD